MPVLIREINFSDVRDNWPPDAMLFCSGFLWRRPSLKIGSVLCSHWDKSPSGVLMCAWYKSMLKIGQPTKARCFLPEVSKVTFYQTQWSQEWILSFVIREMSIPNAHVSSVDLQETMVSVQLKRCSSIDRPYETNFVANSSTLPRRRHMWVEFVVGSLLCSERFFSGYSGFPLSSKPTLPNSNSIRNVRTRLNEFISTPYVLRG